jgi:hypothetical protein
MRLNGRLTFFAHPAYCSLCRAWHVRRES